MQKCQLAQVNVATARYPQGDARIQPFYNQLDDINALAEQSPGFVWRLKSDSGNATDIQVTDDPLLIINLSVWESVEALFEFAYRSAHRGVLVKRRDWFSRPAGRYQALWWVPEGHRPTPDEAMRKLEELEKNGPTRSVFDFKTSFPPPGALHEPEDLKPEPYCAGWD